jgi:hypothetical protein
VSGAGAVIDWHGMHTYASSNEVQVKLYKRWPSLGQLLKYTQWAAQDRTHTINALYATEALRHGHSHARAGQPIRTPLASIMYQRYALTLNLSRAFRILRASTGVKP